MPEATQGTESTPLAGVDTQDLLEELVRRRVLYQDRRDRETFTITRWQTKWKAVVK